MEAEAYRHFSLLPEAFYDLTPRQYHNMKTGREKQIDDQIEMMAIQAVMYRKAMNKKTLKLSDLVGKNSDQNLTKRANRAEKNAEMADLENSLGVPVM